MTAVRTSSVLDRTTHAPDRVVDGELARNEHGRWTIVRLSRAAREALDVREGEDLGVEAGGETITAEVSRDAAGRLVIELACTFDEVHERVLVRRPRCA